MSRMKLPQVLIILFLFVVFLVDNNFHSNWVLGKLGRYCYIPETWVWVAAFPAPILAIRILLPESIRSTGGVVALVYCVVFVVAHITFYRILPGEFSPATWIDYVIFHLPLLAILLCILDMRATSNLRLWSVVVFIMIFSIGLASRSVVVPCRF